MTKESILVIGGSGFIGERLVERLRQGGARVQAPNQDELDIRDLAALQIAFAKADSIVLLTQPDERGITAVVSALALCEPIHVLYASTGLVYASSDSLVAEDASLAPQTPYERSKLYEEEALRAAALRGRHTLTIARLGNVYGGPKNRGIVQKAIEAMHGGEPLVVVGESQRRDFIHVDDVISALAHLLVEGPQGETVNVGSGRSVTIDELLRLLERIAGCGIRWVRSGAVEEKHVVLDTSKLVQSGVTPRVGLEEGLRRTHELYARSIFK